jgi:DNA-binding response OmpR family regulator
MATLLIVEDEPHIRTFIRVNLMSRGFEVIEASSAEEGLEYLGQMRPDAVILDVLLPSMNGWEFLQVMAANKHWEDIPVILMTASTLRTYVPEEDYPNIVQKLIKPVNAQELVETVKQVVVRDRQD